MTGWQRYQAVLAPRGARTALGASLVGRVSLAMNGLALLLVAKQALGSYGQAGLVSAALAVAFAVAAPQRARAADRLGPSRVLLWSAVAHPCSIALFLLLAAAHAPEAGLLATAALIGVTVPPLGSVLRALWPAVVVDPLLLPAAYSLESAAVELCFIVGPLLVAGVAAVTHPGVALAISAVLAGAGSFVLAAVPFVRDVGRAGDDRPRHLAGPLVSPVVRLALVLLLLVGAGFGSTEVCVIAFVEEHGQPRSVAGVVLAVWSLGSMLGGLLYGSLQLRHRPVRQLPWFVGFVGVGAALPVLAHSTLVLGLVIFVYGTAIAPFFSCNALVVGEAAPEGTVTEAFAWNSSMVFGGAALGSAVAGRVIDAAGAHVAFRVGAVSGLLTVLVTLAVLLRGARARRAESAPEDGGGRGLVV
jgi:MFS family permease